MSFMSLILLFCLEALFSLGPEELGSLEEKDNPDAKVLSLRFTGVVILRVSKKCFLRKEFISYKKSIILLITKYYFQKVTWLILY